MTKEIIGYLIIFAIPITMIVLVSVFKKKERNRLARESAKDGIKEDEVVFDDWVFATHNGFTLVMRKEEHDNWWVNMTRKEKSTQVNKTKTAVRKGRFVMVNWNGHVVPVTPGTAKRRGLTPIKMKV